MTLTTEWLKERLKNPRTGTEFVLIKELLANREEATPIYQIWDDGRWYDAEERIWRKTYHEACKSQFRIVYTAPPAPAATTPISFSENADADMCREWAWKQVKEMLTPDGWTVGDNITYFGFFCWGWDMRRQYNEQRQPVVNPEFTGATAVPDGVMPGGLVYSSALPEFESNDSDKVVGYHCFISGKTRSVESQEQAYADAKAVINACRAAMLAQPVRRGCTVAPLGWIDCAFRVPDTDGNYWGWWSESKRQGPV